MLNLDAKVNRPSIHYAVEEAQLGGLFKKLKKKFKKIIKIPIKIVKPIAKPIFKVPFKLVMPFAKPIVKIVKKPIVKVVKLPVKVAKKAVKAVGKVSGKTWKKIGAVAAIGVGAYFAGPKILNFVGGQGGAQLAKDAGKIALKTGVALAINKKLSKQQQKIIAARSQNMSPAQILANPELNQLAQDIAEAEFLNSQPQASNRIGKQLLIKEGAQEIENQTSKLAGKNDDLMKFGIPIAVAIVTSLIA